MNSFTVRAAAIITKYLRLAIKTFAETGENVSLLNQNKLISNNFIDLSGEAKLTENEYFWLNWKKAFMFLLPLWRRDYEENE